MDFPISDISPHQSESTCINYWLAVLFNGISWYWSMQRLHLVWFIHGSFRLSRAGLSRNIILPHPASRRVVRGRLQKIDDVCPVSTPLPSGEPEKSADTDLEVVAVSTTVTSEEQSSVLASTTAVPLTAASSLPDKTVSLLQHSSSTTSAEKG